MIQKHLDDYPKPNLQSLPGVLLVDEEHLRKLLKKEPNNSRAALSIGTIYLQRQDSQNALKWLQHALSLNPKWALVSNNIGKAYELAKDDATARTYYQKAVQLDSNLAKAWFNLAELDVKTGLTEQAIAHYQKAIQTSPAMVAAHNNLGNLLKEEKRFAEAIAAFGTVLKINPKLAQGHYNLGSTYRLLEQYDKAVQHLSEAIKLKPDYADAWNNLAITLKNMGDFARALSYFNRAVQIDPQLAIARWNRSFVNFLLGNWVEGWVDFEARFDVPHWRSIYPYQINGPRWDGNPIPQKTLLVHDEQGIGDTFQFVRFLPWVKQRCGHLILETRPEVASLLTLQRSLGIDEIILRSSHRPPQIGFNSYIPLMSIAQLAQPLPFKTDVAMPYIEAPKEHIDHWQACLPSGAAKIGLAWAGCPEHLNDTNRSCNLTLFSTLMMNKEIQFIGLQKGPAASQADSDPKPNFINLGPLLKDFLDTAAVLSNLDLLITVDTSVAHLAGAMGLPVWVLIPFIPDWRWGSQSINTPWYPTMRLFRQQQPKDWVTVIRQIDMHLRKWLADKK